MLEAAEAGATEEQLQLFVEEPTLYFGCDRFVDLLNSRGAQFGNQLASRFLSGGLRLNQECTPVADGYTRAVGTSKFLTSVRKHMRTLPPGLVPALHHPLFPI